MIHNERFKGSACPESRCECRRSSSVITFAYFPVRSDPSRSRRYPADERGGAMPYECLLRRGPRVQPMLRTAASKRVCCPRGRGSGAYDALAFLPLRHTEVAINNAGCLHRIGDQDQPLSAQLQQAGGRMNMMAIGVVPAHACRVVNPAPTMPGSMM